MRGPGILPEMTALAEARPSLGGLSRTWPELSAVTTGMRKVHGRNAGWIRQFPAAQVVVTMEGTPFLIP